MKFDDMAAFPIREAERETPTGLTNALTLIVVPLCAGGAAFIGAGLVALAFDWPIDIPLAVSGACVLVALVWWALETKTLMYTYERVMGYDANHDGAIGRLPEVTHFSLPAGPNAQRLGELPYPPSLVLDWCKAAANRQSLSYDTWAPRFALPDGTQGGQRYASFRKWWGDRGFLQEIGGNVGCKITREGLPIVCGFAQMTADDGTPLLESVRHKGGMNDG